MKDIENKIDGAVLKNWALFAMTLDHAAKVLIGTRCQILYIIFTGIGRTSFPVFCFLIAEGLYHTADRTKYMIRLLLTGLISILPFHLAFNPDGTIVIFQNIFFTFFISAMSITLIERKKGRIIWPDSPGMITLFMAIIASAIAVTLKTDYSVCGVLLIFVFYYFRNRRDKQITYGIAAYIIGSFMMKYFGTVKMVDTFGNTADHLQYCLSFVESQLPGLLAFILIRFYNGKRGRQFTKYFYYIYYPAHLVILVLLRLAIGGI